MAVWANGRRADSADALPVGNTQRQPAFCVVLAAELAHLRWIVLTQWRCRSCGDAHVHCECKPTWLRLLL